MDDSGRPVTELGLIFSTDQPLDNLNDQGLFRKGPPNYEWALGDIAEESQVSTYAGFIWGKGRFSMTPGFDASRTADKVVFSSPGTQNLTITVTPREERTGELFIRVRTEDSPYVSSAITSYASNERAELSPNKQELTLHDISSEPGVITTINISLQVSPKAPEVESLPEVWVGWREIVNSGTARASSISRGIEDFGSRALSIEGECLWDWGEYVSHVVSWPLVARGAAETKNEILVNFTNRRAYQVWGDEFTNREINGGRDLYTTMINGPDETGESIRGLCLTLTTEQETEEVYKLVAGHIEGSVELGPPEYKWRFGEVPEEPEA